MLVLHHLDNSRSQRILWLLEELGLDYEIQRYQRNPDTQLAPPALQKVHPLGKSPVIRDGAQTLAESGAIILYLATQYGQHLLPEVQTQAYWDCQYWLHYAEGSLMPILLLKLICDKLKEDAPLLARPLTGAVAAQLMKLFVRPNLDRHFAFIESHLEQNEWLAGEALSAADFQMSFPLEAGLSRLEPGRRYPAIAAYVQKIQQRPAYLKALEVGGPYAYA